MRYSIILIGKEQPRTICLEIQVDARVLYQRKNSWWNVVNVPKVHAGFPKSETKLQRKNERLHFKNYLWIKVFTCYSLAASWQPKTYKWRFRNKWGMHRLSRFRERIQVQFEVRRKFNNRDNGSIFECRANREQSMTGPLRNNNEIRG